MAPKKNQKMSLGDFLGDQSLGSWADEMEDMPLAAPDSRTGWGGERRAFTAPGMGMGERSFSNRGYAVREQLPLPTKPPFNAHIGNLSFDATEGDIQDFFDGCGVESVRIVEDKMERKPKGFGYVTFATLDGLKKALEKDGAQFQGRNIRLSVAEPPKDRADAREINDWTRKGPLPDLPSQNQQRRPSERGFGGGRGYEPPANDMGSERGGPRRQNTFNDDGRSRDLGNWERKGPLSPAAAPAPAAGPPREGGRMRSHEGQPPRERKLSPAWGEGTSRSQDGSRPPRGELRERPPIERAPTAAEMDTQWRARMRPDPPQRSTPPTPELSAPSSPAQAAAPAMRPKLNLQKRTVSEAEPSPTAGAADSKASPFGAARPIDTATRERQVEERRQTAAREKKEAEAKAREDRKAQAEKEKAERQAAGSETAAIPVQENGGAEAKENGEEKAPGASYEILRRTTDDKENGEHEGGEGAGAGAGEVKAANGDVVDDKAVKPRETTGQPPTGPRQQGGSWRRGPKQSSPAAHSARTPAADGVEDDGWSTVQSKDRKGRGRGGGGRALAS